MWCLERYAERAPIADCALSPEAIILHKNHSKIKSYITFVISVTLLDIKHNIMQQG